MNTHKHTRRSKYLDGKARHGEVTDNGRVGAAGKPAVKPDVVAKCKPVLNPHRSATPAV